MMCQGINNSQIINVMLEENPISFCYYQVKSDEGSDVISLDSLQTIIDFSAKNNLFLNFIYGNTQLTEAHTNLINNIEHSAIIPVSKLHEQKNALIVIDTVNVETVKQIPDGYSENIILRIAKNKIHKASSYISALKGFYKRLNIILLGIDSFSQNELNKYQKEIEKARKQVGETIKEGHAIELNILTDRLMLNTMQNCNAGIDHITYAPNGNFYICPGFYYDFSEFSIGDCSEGINIPNKQLLNIKNAPICDNCDAYHCKRCFYLNKVTTGEINTPSKEHCVISHYEREQSRLLIEQLKNVISNMDEISPIPKLDYSDPFEILQSDKNKRYKFFAPEQQIKKPELPIPDIAKELEGFSGNDQQKKNKNKPSQNGQEIQELKKMIMALAKKQDIILKKLEMIKNK